MRGFFARIFTWIFARFFVKIFAWIFWGVPNHLLGSGKISPRKSPKNLTMLWGPEGLGRQEGEVETLANLAKARVFEDWRGWVGTSGGSSHSNGFEPKFLKARSKSCQAKEC